MTLERAPLILTAITDATGYYSFGHAPAGEYAATARREDAAGSSSP